MRGLSITDEQIDSFIAGLADSSGYDFTNYTKSSLRRRVNKLLANDDAVSFEHWMRRLRKDPAFGQQVVEQMTINITEMFRDPEVFKTIRIKILPILATYPFVKIWHAGCSTGEEVFSVAILLEEAGMLQKSLLYATDLNPSVIENISKGIFPISHMKQYSENYIAAGGKKDFSSYYTARYDYAKFDDALKSKIIVATHNLVSDRSFNEFQLICCRNVLIYFNKKLQDAVLELFDQSLEKLGFLVLGPKENVKFSSIAKKFVQTGKEKIWRKRD